MRRFVPSVVILVVIAAACGGGDDGDAAPEPATTTTTEAPATTADPATTAAPSEAAETTTTLPDISGIAVAPNDASLPDISPQGSAGVYGWSRYVYQSVPGDQVLPSLIEGPQGYQIRCQELEKECSYLELKALYESAAEVPAYLDMDRDTLGKLVGQLGETEAYLQQFASIDDACARGMFRSSAQSPNMGIHMYDTSAGFRFDPSHPQMVLFAKEGGETTPMRDLGTCAGGKWTGEDGYLPVGVVFNIAQSDDHPDGFAGDLDNWHIHLNLCQGAPIGAVATREQCDEAGGEWNAETESWMMHAYVAPEFDAQGGVFAMFNPAVWPIADPADFDERFTVDTGDGTTPAPITNFDFGEIEVEVGETIRFANTDSVPHTVTAGSAFSPTPDAFDSGLLGTADTFDLSFDQAGEYELFCVLHPDMRATVTVGG